MKLDRHQGNMVPWGSFNPDVDPLTPGVVLSTINAIPTVAGFRSLPSPEVISDPFPGIPTSGTYTIYSDGSSRTVVGSQSHLYELKGKAWIEIDTGQTFVALSRWRFARFGDDLIAVADNVKPQVATGPTGQFANLGGGPPFGAPLVISVGGFVVMTKGTIWYSSAAGADNEWTPSIQTLANQGIFYDVAGPVIALVNVLRTIIAFKNGGVWVGRESGPPETWNMQLVSNLSGTWCQEAVIPLSDRVAFIGRDDFYTSSGYTPEPIPNAPKEWFFRVIDTTRIATMTSRYDPLNSVLWWYFPTKQAPINMTDWYIAYNLRSQRWAAGPQNVSFAVGTTGV